MTINGHGFLFGDDECALELRSGDSCTTLRIY